LSTRLLAADELRAIYTASEVARVVASRHDDGGVNENDVLELAITDGEDEALAILRSQRFTDEQIPTTPETTSRRLKVLVAALAWYNLHRHYQVTPGKVRDDRDKAYGGLRSIGSGEMSANLEGSLAVDNSRPVVASRRRPETALDRPMTMETMALWGHER
jgi:hypothetical protein